MSAPVVVRMRIREWSPVANNPALMGYAEVLTPSGLIYHSTPIFRRADGTFSAGMPSKPRIENGAVVRKPNGKVEYVACVGFATKAARERWSEEVIAALQRDYPEALDGEAL